MVNKFQTMTTKQFVEADDDLVTLKQLLIYVANQCNKMLDEYTDENMCLACKKILQLNGNTFDMVNSVLSTLRENKQ